MQMIVFAKVGKNGALIDVRNRFFTHIHGVLDFTYFIESKAFVIENPRQKFAARFA
jgi:hypothetical protein